MQTMARILVLGAVTQALTEVERFVSSQGKDILVADTYSLKLNLRKVVQKQGLHYLFPVTPIRGDSGSIYLSTGTSREGMPGNISVISKEGTSLTGSGVYVSGGVSGGQSQRNYLHERRKRK